MPAAACQVALPTVPHHNAIPKPYVIQSHVPTHKEEKGITK